MMRSVRPPTKAAPAMYGGGFSARRTSRAGPRKRRALRAMYSLIGIDQPVSSASTSITLALGALVFVGVTAAYYTAIRRHDVELSLEQRLSYGKHVQLFGNRSVYVVDPGNVDPVFSRLSHEDWTKISSKIDFVAFLYDAAVDIAGDDFTSLAACLESISPHGYGIAMFPCGCMIHNVLLQHVSVRFDGMECAMLPGLVLETAAVKWVNTSVVASACQSRRDDLFSTRWYDKHSWKLQKARDEYAQLKTHLGRVDHPDRPAVQGDGPAVRLSGVRKSLI